jgi:hypothetical protein
MINSLLIRMKLRKINKDQWEMGSVKGTVARRNRLTGECQFVLWKAGEQGHAQDFWHKFGPGWDMSFVSDSNKAITQ